MTEQELKEKATKYIGAARQSCPGTVCDATRIVSLANALMISDALLEVAATLKRAVDLPKGD